jgi:hypothetical protein
MKVIRQALWRSAIISYRRGFTGGKAHLVPQGARLRVPDHWKQLLNPQQLEAHDELLRLADKHVAHHTGEREHIGSRQCSLHHRCLALLLESPCCQSTGHIPKTIW